MEVFDHNQPEDTAAVLVGVVHNLWVSLPKTQFSIVVE